MKRRGFTYVEMICVLIILVALTGVLAPMIGNTTTEAQYITTKATMGQLRNAVLQYHQDMKGIPLNRPPQGMTSGIDWTGVPQFLKELQTPPTTSAGALLTDVHGNSILFNPVTQRGWRGPYLQQATGSFQPASTAPSPGISLDPSFYPSGQGSPGTYVYGSNSYGTVQDVAFLDGWSNPVVLQWPVAGSSGLSTAGQDLALRLLYVRLVSAGASSQNGSGNSASVIDTLTSQLMPTRSQRGNDIVLFLLAQDQYPWMP